MQQMIVMDYKKLGMFLALLLLIILIAIPLFCIFFTSIYPNQTLNLLAPLRTLSESNLSEVFWHTIWLGFCVMLTTTVLAVPLAWIFAKTDLCRHNGLDIVLMIPFMTPPYIGSMGWILFMQRNGYLEQLVPAAKIVTTFFFSFGGMVAIMSLHLYPFLYLILRNIFVQISGNKEAAAIVHGGSFLYNFRRIVIPLALSGYAMGALLVFVKTIAEFGTPATFGRKIGYFVMTSEIHQYISHWPIDFGKATALASVLLSACLILWYIQSLICQRFSYPLIGGRDSFRRISVLKNGQRLFAWLYIGGLLGVSIGIPYFSILSASLMKLRGVGLAWNNITFQYYIALLTWGSNSMNALMNSLGLSIVAATISVILGTYCALLIGNSKTRLQRIIDLLSLLPNAVPGIVLVVGFILFWNSPSMPIPLYNTYGMVVLTYAVLFLPYTVQYVKTNYSQLNLSLFQAGQVCGGTPVYILRRILLPLLVPGILAGWMMTFTISIRELVASLLILPPDMETSATFIFSQFEQGNVALGMAMAVVSVGLTTILLLAVNQFHPARKQNG
ncbi:iron(III) transport system permease protein [Sporomusaceae bacterium BoRhaA]|uniref:ABC transporter permease n=1 Tax=Pelorhabdus rhamnosifermentans TaxID=2772457 RepID=UPI001C061578|nr:iron ABC transporter permease [Pelorhabdus rhamnosifermentans]MBU2703548.1 iron(III) transport system permease protein [Pelorhabdus rhamnosifermentans]